MINRFIRARLAICGLAFFFLSALNTNATVLGDRWIEDQESIRQDLQLMQINKLSSDLSTIQLELKNNSYCELALHDMEGNLIQPIEAEQKKKGKHLVLWKHINVPAGTYLLILRTDHGSEQMEVLLE